MPGAEGADVEGVAKAEGGGAFAEIGEGDLKHALGGDPIVGLMEMEMEGFDGAGVAESGGNLGGFGGEFADEAFAEAGDFEEIAAVIGPKREGFDGDTIDALGGAGFEDDGPDSFGVAGNYELKGIVGGENGVNCGCGHSPYDTIQAQWRSNVGKKQTGSR